MRTEERYTPIQGSADHARCTCSGGRIGGGRGVMRSLLVLLLVLVSTWANVNGPEINHDPGNDVERSWHLDTAGKPLDDDIQKCSK